MVQAICSQVLPNVLLLVTSALCISSLLSGHIRSQELSRTEVTEILCKFLPSYLQSPFFFLLALNSLYSPDMFRSFLQPISQHFSISLINHPRFLFRSSALGLKCSLKCRLQHNILFFFLRSIMFTSQLFYLPPVLLKLSYH